LSLALVSNRVHRKKGDDTPLTIRFEPRDGIFVGDFDANERMILPPVSAGDFALGT
jgi:hypothetical protein